METKRNPEFEQKLFNYLADQYGILLMEDDFNTIDGYFPQLILKDKRQLLEDYEEYRATQRPNGTFGENNKELIDGFLKIKL